MRLIHLVVRSISILLLGITCLGKIDAVTVVHAQGGAFNSGSNGSDGALNLTTPGTYTFDPGALTPPRDVDGDNIYHFTTIHIGPGVTVTLSAKVINGPIYWLASGDVTIDGVIDLSGEGYINPTIPVDRRPSVPGSGGYPGGIGGYGDSPPQSGRGPGGGQIIGGCTGGAGHVTLGNPSPCGGASYGNDFLVPLIGGSGGAGLSGTGAAGSAGGGAILIASSTMIRIQGAILANMGGEGRNEEGGLGSGGSIRLVAPTLTGNGVLQAFGCLACSAGRGGSYGRIRLEAFQHTFTGTTNPAPILRSPIPLFLPTHPPSSVRVSKIANATAPLIPNNDVASPDVTINSSGTVTVTIEAHYVPLGSTVTLVLIPEEGPDQILISTPLVGTLQQSTAVVTMTIPTGNSRMYVYSKWSQ